MAHKELPLDFWKGHTSEEVLFNIVAEMDQPLKKIRFYSQLLLTADVSEEERIRALNSIQDGTTFLESIVKATKEYTSSLRRK
jgi:hypothetical protein